MINNMIYRIFSKKNNSRGFTFVELLLATLILVIASVAILQSFIVEAYFSTINRGRTAAMTDLSNMMEAIISTPFSDITAKFPNGTKDGGGNPYTNITGNYTIKNETISVTYKSINTDPLEINVTLNWKGGKGNWQTTSLVTKKTR